MRINTQNYNLAFFLILLIIIPFITISSILNFENGSFSPNIFDNFLDINLYPKLFTLNIFLLISSLLSLFILKKNEISIVQIVKSKTIIFYFIYFNFVVISSFFATSVSLSVNEILKVFSFLLLLIYSATVISNMKTPKVTISKIIVFFGLIAAIIGFIQLVIILQNPKLNLDHQLTYLIKATFSHRNIFSQLLLLSLGFSFYVAIKCKKIWRIISVIGIILQLVLISILLVRSVWLALAISGSISLLFFLFINKKDKSKSINTTSLIIYPLIIIGIIVITLFSVSKFDSENTLKKQISWIKKTPFGSVKERLNLWEASIKMIQDKPLVGQGAGNWAIVLPKYFNEEIRENKEENIFTNFQRAHNDYLQTAAEIGVFGLIFYLLIFASALYNIFKRVIYDEDKLFLTILLFSIISYLIVSFFSFPKERIESSIIIVIILALSISLNLSTKGINRNFDKKGLAIIFFSIISSVLAYSIYANYKILEGEHHTKEAYLARRNNQNKILIKKIAKAYSPYYKTDLTSTPLMWYSGTASFVLNDVQKALTYFKQAYKDAPYNKHNLNDLATAYEVLGNRKEALKFYRKSISVSPHFTDPLLNISIIMFKSNLLDSSYYYFRDINTETKSNNYLQLRDIILPQMIRNISMKYYQDSVVYNVFQRFLNSKEWMIKIHNQSVVTNNSLEKQLLIDVIYLLEEVDKSISSDEAEQLKSKYI